MADDFIALLLAEAERLRQRLAAIEVLLGESTGDGFVPLPTPTTRGGRRLQVGDDKLNAIRAELRRRNDWVRQAELTHATGMNSGTVSTALALLGQRGEVEAGDKQDRSTLWRLAK